MKVYIVQEDNYHESEEVLGVYSTKELADEAAMQAMKADPLRLDAMVVIEAELDKPISNPTSYVHGHAIASYPVGLP